MLNEEKQTTDELEIAAEKFEEQLKTDPKLQKDYENFFKLLNQTLNYDKEEMDGLC